MVETMVLQQAALAFALGALVGLERERASGKKYAGLRTLSLFTAAGPLAVAVARISTSVVPVGIYLLLGATFSLVILAIRMETGQENIGLTTSSTVFLMSFVGVLVGYEEYFTGVAITLIAVFLLAEKTALHRYASMLDADEISDAVALGILALVLYPILPEGAVDPYGVLFLRKALLFVIFVLLVQFAAFVGLQWMRSRMGFLLSTAVSGVVSSLAVVSTMAGMVRDGDLGRQASAASTAAVAAMVARNGFIAAVLAPETAPYLAGPFALAALVGVATTVYYSRDGALDGVDYGERSPFSFMTALRFGALFLTILMVAEVAQTQLSIAGAYGTAFLGGFASSTAVVASAAALLGSGAVTPHEAAIMVALGAAASLLSKLFYTEWGDARPLTRALAVPYLAMAAAVLLVAVL